jgi:hypothetical protein
MGALSSYSVVSGVSANRLSTRVSTGTHPI